MIIEPIGIAALLIGPLCIVLGLRFAAAVLIISTLFGASAAIILPAVGNANIQPAHLMLGFFALSAATKRSFGREAAAALTYPRPGFWLALTVLYGIVSAYYFPRLFLGATYVFGLRGETGGSVTLSPLGPSSGNVTQTVYFISDLVCFIICYVYAASHSGKRALGTAILLCGVINLLFAILDVATYAVNAAELLAPIRNATYRMLNDTESIGLKRVVGSFSEASAFGYATLGLFAFSTRLWLEGVYPRTTLVVSGMSLVALSVSTSTTAYVGTSIFLILNFVRYLWGAISGRVTRQMLAFIVAMPILTVAIVTGILLNDSMEAYIHDALNTVLLTKLSSSSGVERTAWNAQAMVNFFDTYAIGSGIGSLRASSFPVAVLGSMGMAGAVLYAAFLSTVVVDTGAAPPDGDWISTAMQKAARSACLALLIAASFTSAFVDLGLQFFVLAALGSAPRQPVARTVESQPVPSSPPVRVASSPWRPATS
jgi:hypothetical protein